MKGRNLVFTNAPNDGEMCKFIGIVDRSGAEHLAKDLLKVAQGPHPDYRYRRIDIEEDIKRFLNREVLDIDTPLLEEIGDNTRFSNAYSIKKIPDSEMYEVSGTYDPFTMDINQFESEDDAQEYYLSDHYSLGESSPWIGKNKSIIFSACHEYTNKINIGIYVDGRKTSSQNLLNRIIFW